ncbi:hypothetical protein [Riemerella anatipestifer]|uniref:hypothetical protein n=1 Tax=Riemerella anatipestifer TaxID=34085 RepID=UPI0021F8A791|nr:hypothetical protein [Riemerella anatipestifer]MCW0510667.1 hypothetical protein [Riemerella anatipestifer]MCW0518434.1 hypothetical protein [Riemerella anatipestifer]MDR7782917.1 hypothetical protein [Riemerella anatipestifer]MDY3345974.1 hypothetical protein [Riemerella anatipestifer]MDY3348317.1 hypothetical protein [Riemerella anatipestifer]
MKQTRCLSDEVKEAFINFVMDANAKTESVTDVHYQKLMSDKIRFITDWSHKYLSECDLKVLQKHPLSPEEGLKGLEKLKKTKWYKGIQQIQQISEQVNYQTKDLFTMIKRLSIENIQLRAEIARLKTPPSHSK